MITVVWNHEVKISALTMAQDEMEGTSQDSLERSKIQLIHKEDFILRIKRFSPLGQEVFFLHTFWSALNPLHCAGNSANSCSQSNYIHTDILTNLSIDILFR